MHRKQTLPGARLLSISGLLLLLAGCSSDQSDLMSYIEDVKARPGGAIEPLPEIRPAPVYDYAGYDKRSPFIPDSTQAPVNASTVGMPDFERPREELEKEPLDALTMVGTLRNAAGDWGLIQAPDGLVHRVTVGNHMGQNFGRITSISDTRIELVEIVRDELGGYMERPAAIGLND
jgi:type IV pilus assembly protein PilP